MNVRSCRHRGLKRLLEADDDRDLGSNIARRVRNVLTVLLAARTMNGVVGPPGWRIHQLSGDRLGYWSISVSGNWRITFRLEDDDILDLDLEDYH